MEFALKLPAVSPVLAPLLLRCQRWSVRLNLVPHVADSGGESGALRVVIADDVADAADTLAALLRHSGCEVWVVNDGRQALQQVQDCQPHCLIYDVVMPFLSGQELTRRIRALYGSNIVLIAMSGFERDDPRVAETFDAADHYFVKPVDLKALARVLSLTA